MRIDEINQQIVIKFAVWKWIKKDIRALSKEQLRDFLSQMAISHFVVIKCMSGCGVKDTV
jgi:hypothetical protein